MEAVLASSTFQDDGEPIIAFDDASGVISRFPTIPQLGIH
jgi:hypothetical protein